MSVVVFIGMAVATTGKRSLEDSGDCDAAGKNIIKNLLVFEVASY